MSYFTDLFISTNLKIGGCGEYSTWNYVFEGKVNSDIVIYGSSRALKHISPEIFIKSLHISTYNLGIDGHNFWLQNFRHRMLLKNNTKPKIIIFSIDMFTLQKRKDLYNLEQFLPYMLWNKEMQKVTSCYEGFNRYDYEIPLVRYFGRKQSLVSAIRVFSGHLGCSSYRIRGYQGIDRSWTTDFDNTKFTNKKYEVILDTETLLLFKRFLIECKSKNIKLIFVYTPEYIEGQKFVKNRGVVMSIFTNLSKQYHIPFYDYSSDPISHQKIYFYNANHLNKTGAELFTTKLIDTLKQSNLIKNLNN